MHQFRKRNGITEGLKLQEKLQNNFNKTIFRIEQDEYIKEGIKWKKMSFNDNQSCIDLIEDKLSGILGSLGLKVDTAALLDEECVLPTGSDKSFLEKLELTHNKRNQDYIKPKRIGSFGIRHFAGEVTYDTNGFLDKNKDT